MESIFIATDNDEAGNRAAEKLAELIPKEKFVYRLLPQAKDWNEDLVNEVRPIFWKAGRDGTKYKLCHCDDWTFE